MRIFKEAQHFSMLRRTFTYFCYVILAFVDRDDDEADAESIYYVEESIYSEQ